MQFGGVFDGDNPLLGIDKNRERVQKCGLTGAGSAGDNDVQLRLDGRFQQFDHALCHGLAFHQIGRHQLVGGKAANGKDRAVHRQRRNNGVDARAVD